jgi:hypothetical protein
MATVLPPLTAVIGKGAAGGHEFERLMHQLLLQDAKSRGYSYEPVRGEGADNGIDGWAAQGLPEVKGPVAFQFRWRWGDIRKETRIVRIRYFQRSSARLRGDTHFVIVTPEELNPTEQDWFTELASSSGLQVHHWGPAHIEALLRGSPALFARYYPQEAQSLPGGQGSVDFRKFADSYRERVGFSYQYLRTLGLPPETLRERDAIKHIPLRNLFIPLRFVSEGAGAEAQSLTEMLDAGKSAVILVLQWHFGFRCSSSVMI